MVLRISRWFIAHRYCKTHHHSILASRFLCPDLTITVLYQKTVLEDTDKQCCPADSGIRSENVCVLEGSYK